MTLEFLLQLHKMAITPDGETDNDFRLLTEDDLDLKKDHHENDAIYPKTKKVTLRNKTIGKWFFILLGISACFLTTGVYFGWGGIGALFENENVYFNYCEDDDNDEITDGTCTDQLERIQLLFTLGTFMFSLSSIPIGFFLDKCGRALTMAVGFFVASVGAILIAVTPTQSKKKQQNPTKTNKKTIKR